VVFQAAAGAKAIEAETASLLVGAVPDRAGAEHGDLDTSARYS
jgi:hypothetical protein